MSFAETQHSENMHARWSHARRYMIMTRAVSLVLLLTSGLMMHATFVKTGSDAMAQFEHSSVSPRQSRTYSQWIGDPVGP
tara:strand:- start:544 stop:783 length:240 start_codon:yes stop_codon:yes gene_type:complete